MNSIIMALIPNIILKKLINNIILKKRTRIWTTFTVVIIYQHFFVTTCNFCTIKIRIRYKINWSFLILFV
jgi:hypothetical protein